MTPRLATARFALLLVVIGAHTLRNVSLPGYLAAYGLVSLLALVDVVRTRAWRRLADSGAVVVAWLAIAAAGALVTVLVSGPAAAAHGLSRFLFAFPVFLGLLAWTDTRRRLVVHTGLLVGLFALLSLTLPLQAITGAIPFFATPGWRAGEVRYASAVGSLTAIGIIVGCYLALAQGLRQAYRWPLVVVIGAVGIISLSKAAFLNVGLAFLALLWMNRRNKVFLGVALVGIPAAVGAMSLASTSFRDRLATSLAAFGVTSAKSVVTEDMPIWQALGQRLTILPAISWDNLHQLGGWAPWTGGGYAMGGTALVPAEAARPMAHNQLFESLCVFGVPLGLLQWGIMTALFVVTCRRWAQTRDDLDAALLLAWGFFALNALTANGILYQPLSGAVLWLLVFAALAVDPNPASQVTWSWFFRTWRRHALAAGVAGIIAGFVTWAILQLLGDSPVVLEGIEDPMRVISAPAAAATSFLTATAAPFGVAHLRSRPAKVPL